MDNIYVIVGLGNPGREYEDTRHNVGFRAIDCISESYGINVNRLKHKALIGEGSIGDKKVVLAKPQTFMNSSGESVREIINWYKIPFSNCVLIYDDVDIDLGKIRVRAKGSAGTHNGMRSVVYQIQSDEFPRVRIGIGKPPERMDIVDFVLGRFLEGEKKIIGESIANAAKAAAAIVEYGVDKAMNLYNSR